MQEVLFQIIPLDGKSGIESFSLSGRSLSCYELIFVASGYVIKEFQLNSIRINQRDFHVSLPGQITSLTECADNLNGFYCRFNIDFLEHIYMKAPLEKELAFINSFMHHYPLRLSRNTSNRLDYIFRTITDISGEHETDLSLIHAYMVVLIYEVKKLMIGNHLNLYPSKAFSVVEQYNKLLTEYAGKEHSAGFYADQLNISTNHLNKSVKIITGKTAFSLLNETLSLKAKVQLKHTDKPVGEIAYELGFEDKSYFSRFFKKITGLTPIEYRNEGENRK